GSGSVSLGLSVPFPFFGIAQTDVRISTNGYMTFSTNPTDGNVAGNVAIPGAAVPDNMIAPLWDNLDNNSSGVIAYGTYDVGLCTERFIAEWFSVPANGSVSGINNTFEAILYPSGIIEFRYATLEPATLSATIGVENPAGSAGTSVTQASLGSGDTARVFVPG